MKKFYSELNLNQYSVASPCRTSKYYLYCLQLAALS